MRKLEFGSVVVAIVGLAAGLAQDGEAWATPAKPAAPAEPPQLVWKEPTPVCDSDATCIPRCDKGEGAACEAMGVNLFHLKHKPDEAMPFFRKACQVGYQHSCYLLGKFTYMGSGGLTEDHAKGTAMLTSACTAGEPPACDLLGDYLDDAPDQAKAAFTMHERACTLGMLDACTGVGWAYVYAKGVPKDLAKAKAIFKRTCKAAGPAEASTTTACQAAKQRLK